MRSSGASYLPNCFITSKGVVYGVGAWKVGEIKDTPHMKEAYEMGKRI